MKKQFTIRLEESALNLIAVNSRMLGKSQQEYVEEIISASVSRDTHNLHVSRERGFKEAVDISTKLSTVVDKPKKKS